jgi:hypothetical protein
VHLGHLETGSRVLWSTFFTFLRVNYSDIPNARAYCHTVGSTYDSSPALILPTVAFPLAFDHVSLDQRKSQSIRLEAVRNRPPLFTASASDRMENERQVEEKR